MSPMSMLPGLEKRLGYEFADRNLLLNAIAHKSFIHEKNGHICDNYERLEFLGDSILGFFISDFLFRKHPDYSEGKLSRVKSKLISGATLALIAGKMELGHYLLIGKGEEKTGGRRKRSLLADILESLIGAIYLDGGIDAAKKFIEDLYNDFLGGDNGEIKADNYKTELQEFLQASYKCMPSYTIVAEEGPDHEKIFHVTVEALGTSLGNGWGKSKKEAETMAAKLAYQALVSGKVKL
ncbi:MAG: ribonuclease III [Candidatus Theseobacter exili]|nr:ribonuclease III [Candidatus Theseobacter exili]